jgi:transposase
MEVLHARCAGLDVSKKDAKVCVRVQGAGSRKTSATVTTWRSMTNDILRLRDHLAAEKVSCVVMESTGDYWKPFYYALEDALPVMLVNPREARNRPGRKTDVSDAAWLADLAAHGLVRGSFVPPEPIRQLRDLTRARTALARDRGRLAQKIEKVLESSGIKLSAVATDITGVSGRAMLEALIAGERDPEAMAELAKRRLRRKIPDLTQALNGRFTEHHGFMIRMHLDLIDQHTRALEKLQARIEEMIKPFAPARELLCSIPGWSTKIAEVFIAETGADMSVFPTAAELVSWAGLSPGANESAGRVKSSKTRPGNRHLKAAVGIAALAAARSTSTTFFGTKFRRITARRGPMKAVVAVEHAMVKTAWHILVNGEFYRDPGPDYYTQRRPEHAKASAVRQLEALGYRVVLEKPDAA